MARKSQNLSDEDQKHAQSIVFLIILGIYSGAMQSCKTHVDETEICRVNFYSANKRTLTIFLFILNKSYNWELRKWNQMKNDPRSCERNLCDCVRSLKKIQDFKGVEPVTLRYQCDSPTNWAIKILMLGAGQLCAHMFRYLPFASSVAEYRYVCIVKAK